MAGAFRHALTSGEFIVTCEMIPGRGAREAAQIKEFEHIEAIYATGRVHAISVTDNPGGNPALLADEIARELADRGVETLVHFSCKDRSRNHMQSQLYALERTGLENLLVMTGDYQGDGFMGKPRPVFDLDSVQTLMLVADMNKGLVVENFRGQSSEAPTGFFSGAVVNPFKYTEGEAIPQYLKLERKILAGAQFVVSQLGYDARKMHELIRYVRQSGYNTPLIANVFLATKGVAKLMQDGAIAGCYASDEFMAQLEKEAGVEDKGKTARIERAAQMVAIAKGLGYAGVHIGGFGLTADVVNAVLDRADELADDWQGLVLQLNYGAPGGYYLYDAAIDVAGNATGLNMPALLGASENVTGKKLFGGYRFSRFLHRWVLTRGKRGYGLLSKIMDWREGKKGLHRSHAIEHMSKSVLYGCLDCGDCGLDTCVYTCPMAKCPKCQRNGPCGGSMDGWCEVYPNEKYCIFYKAYHRLKRYNEIYKMARYTTPPNDWALNETSSWSNYTHERDNAAYRIPVSIGKEIVEDDE